MRKSDRTRAGILEAARALFAEHGYEGTTVRAIAERASIDPSMIIRYFGGKDGLFSLASKVELGLSDINPTAPVPVGAMLVEHFLELWEGSGKDMGLVILLRAAATNEDAAERIRTIFREQVLPAAAQFGDPTTAETRAGLVVSQLFGLALCRYILAIPSVAAMSRADIVENLAPVVDLHLFGDGRGKSVR
tara:strand:+ start:1802 stop:2374 length:573 start_codon:yes stop_codon:yes gene_type:complete